MTDQADIAAIVRGALDGLDGARDEADDRPGWAPVDLAPYVQAVRDGVDLTPKTGVLARADGAGLLYPGRINTLFGPPESAKTWIALAAAVQVLERGGTAMMLDFEDDPGSQIARVASLGGGLDAIAERFVYLAPERPMFGPGTLDRAMFDELAALLEERRPALIIVDSANEMAAVSGLDPNSTVDMTWQAAILRRIGRVAESTVLVIDHIAKGSGSSSAYVTEIGSQAKGAASNGVRFHATRDKIFAPGRTGEVTLRIMKDRPGGVRKVSSQDDPQVATVVRLMSDSLDGSVEVAFDAPPNVAEPFRPTWWMARLCEAIVDAGEAGIRQRDLFEIAKRIKPDTKDSVLRAALRALHDGGHTREIRAEGGTAYVCDVPFTDGAFVAAVPAPNPHHDEPF